MCLGAVPVHVFVDAYVHVCGEPVHRSIYALSILTVEMGSHTEPGAFGFTWTGGQRAPGILLSTPTSTGTANSTTMFDFGFLLSFACFKDCFKFLCVKLLNALQFCIPSLCMGPFWSPLCHRNLSI